MKYKILKLRIQTWCVECPSEIQKYSKIVKDGNGNGQERSLHTKACF